MHRDVKLGLALGILIIGVAAAFCFPRQPAPDLVQATPVAGPRLAVVDDDIRQLRVRSFVEEELSPESRPALKTRASAIEEPQSLGDVALTEALAAAEAIVPAPAPIPIPEPTATAADQTMSAAVANALPVAQIAPQTPQSYTVQPGDTLSSIAQRLLGSSRKYTEVYEANRDILANPDALYPGLVLTMPTNDVVAPSSSNLAVEPQAITKESVLR